LTACGAAGSDTEDDLVNPSLDAGDDVATLDAADGSFVDLDDAGSTLDAGPDVIDASTDADEEDEEEDDEEFREPDCTGVEIPPEPPQIECDLLAEPGASGCHSTAVCMVYFIDAEDVCGQSTYGTRCSLSGGRQPGQSCDFRDDCVQGSACLITTTGRKCAKLCRLDDPGACEEGLVCWPVEEIPNLGGCW